MDQALNFIDEAILENLGSFDNFGKPLDQSEIDINNNWEEKRRELKYKMMMTTGQGFDQDSK